MAQHPVRSTEAFFGRRRGKTLRAGQAEALERLRSTLSLDLTAPPPERLPDLFMSRVSEVRVEIGFGGGEHLLHQIGAYPDTGFIGVEPFVNGMAKLAASIGEVMPENLRVHDDDATVLLDWLPDKSIAGIDLLYPDPWPKKKHWKRRFVNRANLDRFARVMQSGAIFRFASDIETYVNWTLQHIDSHPSFDWIVEAASDWSEPFPGWPGTRYEMKAKREGRAPAYLQFRKR